MRRAVPPPHRAFARSMRADATKAENMLWQALRNKQLEGLKFKRQESLDGSIRATLAYAADRNVRIVTAVA